MNISSNLMVGILGINNANNLNGGQNMRKAMLVYQAGIANVFEVDCFNLSPYGREAKRLLQSSFDDCISFANGLGAAGVTVMTVACNQAGDIVNAHWSEDLDSQPFSEHFTDLRLNTKGNLA